MFRRLITTSALVKSVAPRATQPVLRRNYHKKDKRIGREGKKSITIANLFAALLDHDSNPRNVGSLPETDEDVGTGLLGLPLRTSNYP